MLKQIGVGILASAIAFGGTIMPAISQPAPEVQFTPKARVTLNGDRVNITLVNKTNAAINYQVVGDTQFRTLAGQGTATLQGLRVPMTVTLDRQDSGLLRVTPKQAEKSPNTIEVTLDTTTDLAIDGTTMRVEANGSVFLY
ncbi:MAG: hypothetical protein KME10_09770 [Plectolyngbya sp. WJT66-NPBG17]|jgi:hypothetical protein|nr:hypothetical protein [Plectolyngbya sp. WJT66-NPBG17]